MAPFLMMNSIVCGLDKGTSEVREIEKIEKNVEGEKLGSHDGCSHAVTAGEIRS